MAVRHLKRLRIGDSPTGGIVPKPSHWHETHLSPEYAILQISRGWGLTDGNEVGVMTTGPTLVEVGGLDTNLERVYPWRTRYNFANIDQVCIEVTSGAEYFIPPMIGEYRAQYSNDEGVSWNYFDGLAGPFVSVNAALGVNTVLRGDWVTLPGGAKVDSIVRVVMHNGDGTYIFVGAITVWGR